MKSLSTAVLLFFMFYFQLDFITAHRHKQIGNITAFDDLHTEIFIIKIESGIGGNTVATYTPSNAQLIIVNTILHHCEGKISEEDGSCSGKLKPLDFENETEFCYLLPIHITDGVLCLTPAYNVSFGHVGADVFCQPSNGPYMLLNHKDYHSLCNDVATAVSYKYFPKHSIAKEVFCFENNSRIICTYDIDDIYQHDIERFAHEH